jgi:hypothetical protein
MRFSTTGWLGASRGHWEGDTLVVESRNFNGKGWIATGRNWGRLYGVLSTDQLRITARFTRLDAKTLRYQVTVEDPERSGAEDDPHFFSASRAPARIPGNA